VDDLVASGASNDEMERLGERLEQLATSAGFSLKTQVDDSIFDLAAVTAPIEVVGYGFDLKSGELDVTISESGWNQLEQHLVDLHADVDAPFHAVELIEAWLRQNIPCLSPARKDEHVQHIVRLLRRCALSDFPGEELVTRIYDLAIDQRRSDSNRDAPELVACSPGDGEHGTEEPAHRLVVFVHAWLPRPRGPQTASELPTGGWAWAITDSTCGILAHGSGAGTTPIPDRLATNCLREIAAVLPDVVAADTPLEIVMDSTEFKRRLENGANSVGDSEESAEASGSLDSDWRSVARGLAAYGFEINLLTRRDLDRLESSPRRRLARSVRFWAEQAAREQAALELDSESAQQAS